MPNGHNKKEYGGHKYDADHDGTSDCTFHCGCWMGPARSGGPVGLDPHGACPGNPKDGNFLGRTADYENVVTYRIQDLESDLYRAKEQLKHVSPSKKKLTEELATTQEELANLRQMLGRLKQAIVQTGV